MSVPRQATGTIESYAWKDGRTVTWRLRVRAYGQRHRVDLGTNHEGWNRERARVELDQICGQIERGTWEPPSKVAMVKPESAGTETFHVTASRWWNRESVDLEESTRRDYLWRLGFLLAELADEPTSAIDVRRVDELKEGLSRQRNRNNGKPLSGRTINMILGLLAQILDDAVEYGLLEQNPARGRRRRVRESRPARSFLEPDMVVALLDAAGKWEAELPPHQHFGRRALLATLCLAGLRLGEATSATLADLNLHGARLRVVDAKTPAGHRDVELTAFLLSELRAHLAALPARHSSDLPRTLPIFPTSNGKPHSASNVRRMLRSSVERANDLREAESKMLLPEKLTPHSLRRTFASLALTAGRDPRWVMGQIGHTDARLTLNVYAQVIQRQRVDRRVVEQLMRFNDEEASDEKASRQAGEPAYHGRS